MPKHNQFHLLIEKRFAPFFWTQFSGAFNDNVFRNALIILLAFSQVPFAIDRDILINICAGLFILPFALFSSTAGQLADKYNKAYLIRFIKLAEILLTFIALIAFYLDSTPMLICVLFLLGTQSAFFGPVKYSILPQYLDRSELLGGNGIVEMGTFIAILTGTITGGVLIALSENGDLWVAGTLIVLAMLGFIASLNIPHAPSADPNLKINWNIFKTSVSTLKMSAKRRPLFLSIIGISWFWAYGGTFITQLPHYVQAYLYGNEQIAILFLATFSIGIGIGSLLCERLSGDKLELGLVPFGSIGMTLLILDLSFAHLSIVPSAPRGAWIFLQHFSSWHIILDLLFVGFFAGFYVVPLYTFLQYRSHTKIRSQMIAANNLMNTFFMVAAAILAICVYQLNLNTPHLFFIMGILNACIAIYIFRLLPEFFLSFINWLLISLMYRIQHQDLKHIPKSGAAILICNHASFVDPLIIASACHRPIRFVMDNGYYHLPGLHFLFKLARAIPITTAKEDPKILKQAFESISNALEQGHLIAIFPEGRLTRNGKMNRFQPGIRQILARNPVPIVPMALHGLWGSFFSWKHGKIMRHFPRNLPFNYKIDLIAGTPISPDDCTLKKLEQSVLKLLKIASDRSDLPKKQL